MYALLILKRVSPWSPRHTFYKPKDNHVKCTRNVAFEERRSLIRGKNQYIYVYINIDHWFLKRHWPLTRVASQRGSTVYETLLSNCGYSLRYRCL